ncbi:MAG: hypothetical protein IBJ08_15680 [Pseudomonas sp.]|nr:hypothetical protein [Pseudomonas sp.]
MRQELRDGLFEGRTIDAVRHHDHVLVGEGIGVQDVTLLDDVGADHLGVRATLRVPGASVAVG